MKNHILAFASVALVITAFTTAAGAADDDIAKHMIVSATGDSWNVWGAQGQAYDDPAVQAGKATRATIKKGAHIWDSAGTVPINTPIKKGDVILAAYWARVETPAPGSSTATIGGSIGLSQSPYTSFANENATLTSKWTMYYASGVADADHKPGTLNVGVQLASDDQVIDLGPVFVLDFGPDYDQSKLPHNKVAMAAPAAPADRPAGYSADLAKLQARLPVKGTLMNDPGTLYGYGSDLTTQPIDAPELAGGKATRAIMTKAGAQPWDDGVSSPGTAAVKKGDMIFVAAYLRATQPAPGTETGQVTAMGASLGQSPWTVVAPLTGIPTLPKGQWKLVYAAGMAEADYPAGSINFGMQLGGSPQTLDIGPVYVLNLGQGVKAAALPKNQ